MINGVDVSDPTRNFTADGWTSLCWNGGWAYIAQVRERMKKRGHRGRGGERDGGREYGCGGSTHNVNELNVNSSGGNDEGSAGRTGTRARARIGTRQG